MAHIETKDGTKLYVKEWGSGRPVILLHGWPLSADSWDDHAVAIAEAGMRAVSYDRRGFGRSDQPWDGYDYDTLSDDLATVIESTGSSDCAVIGFSMGGGEVARYMSRHSGKSVKQAGLISSVVPYMLKTADNPDGTDASVFAEMTAGMKKDRAEFFASFFNSFYGVGVIDKPVSDEVLEWSRAVSMSAGLRPTLACAEAFATTDFRPDLKAFRVPTLIVHGTDDKTVPIKPSAHAAAAGISHAQFIEYEGAPHGLLASHKERFQNDLLAFLKS
ncbi:MAG: alpha/beta hydrolase [Phycisphaerae bacterium]|nr:alpha/beta hydrolase [Gemmatimonadaceae bacterium]